MRYALRNKEKLWLHYDKVVVDRIFDSLATYFNSVTNIKNDIKPSEPYPLLIINDTGHTCGVIIFHIISVKYDTYRLAFKEFVN